MRLTVFPIVLASALAGSGAVEANPGHLAEVAGHDHWLGAAAIGAAIALGLWAALKGRKAPAAAEAADDADDAETQDA